MILQSDINLLPNYNDKLMDARTVAFISLVWSENVRSYTSRSFQNPVWHNLMGNQNRCLHFPGVVGEREVLYVTLFPEPCVAQPDGESEPLPSFPWCGRRT